MKPVYVFVLSCCFLAACGGEQKTAKEVADEWCVLNAAVHNAKDEASFQKAKAAQNKFQNEMTEKYDVDFIREVGHLFLECTHND